MALPPPPTVARPADRRQSGSPWLRSGPLWRQMPSSAGHWSGTWPRASHWPASPTRVCGPKRGKIWGCCCQEPAASPCSTTASSGPRRSPPPTASCGSPQHLTQRRPFKQRSRSTVGGATITRGTSTSSGATSGEGSTSRCARTWRGKMPVKPGVQIQAPLEPIERGPASRPCTLRARTPCAPRRHAPCLRRWCWRQEEKACTGSGRAD
mmetsp:Transcript_63132/g.159253  ORF Transcript_63132/g.159253 Transcript_63132/m.159253 type:complete len:209 (-) Transcript_63132:143-769(-)